MRYDDDRSGPFGVLIAVAVMFIIAGVFAATVVVMFTNTRNAAEAERAAAMEAERAAVAAQQALSAEEQAVSEPNVLMTINVNMDRDGAIDIDGKTGLSISTFDPVGSGSEAN